jgi:hypothetical protein
VAEWRRHRSTKPESAGSTPAVDAHLAVAQWTRAPPSEGGGRTFESCRRGHALVVQGASARPRYGRGRLHAAVVQRTRRRALNPEAGVRLPVAVLDARSSNRKDVGLLLRLWGFESSSGSASPGGRGSRHAAADRVTGVRVPPGRPCRSDATERGSFLTSNTPRVGDPAASRRGYSRHASFQRVHGSQTTWSSFNGEDASTPRS